MNATVEYVGSPDLGQCNDHVLEHFIPQLCESRSVYCISIYRIMTKQGRSSKKID